MSKRDKAQGREVTMLDVLEERRVLQARVFELDGKLSSVSKDLELERAVVQNMEETNNSLSSRLHSETSRAELAEKAMYAVQERLMSETALLHEQAEDVRSLSSRLGEAIKFADYIAKRHEEGWDEPVTERFYNEAKQLLSALERQTPK